MADPADPGADAAASPPPPAGHPSRPSKPDWATAKAQVEARKAERRARVAAMTPEQRKRRKMLQIGGAVVAAIVVISVVVAVSGDSGEKITLQATNGGVHAVHVNIEALSKDGDKDLWSKLDFVMEPGTTRAPHGMRCAGDITVFSVSLYLEARPTATNEGILAKPCQKGAFYHLVVPDHSLEFVLTGPFMPQDPAPTDTTAPTSTPTPPPKEETYRFNFTLANDSNAALSWFECQLADGDGQGTGPDCAADAQLAPAGGRSTWTVEWTPALGLSNPPWLQVSASLDDGSSPSALYQLQNLSRWAAIEIHVTADAIIATCVNGCTAQEP